MTSLLLDSKTYPLWMTQSFPIIRIVLFAIVVLCAIIVIASTLFQNEDSSDTEVITGTQESYYSKNKGGSRDAKLKLITIICSSILAVCTVLYFVSFLILPIGA